MKAAYEHIHPGARASFAFRTWVVPGFPFKWHFHPEFELTLIERGTGKRFVGDHIDDYQAGDVVLLGPDLPHTWYSPVSAPVKRRAHKSIVVQFLPAFLGKHFFDRPEFENVRRLLDRSQRGLQFSGRDEVAVAKKLIEMEHQNPFTRLTQLLEILDRLSRSKQARALSSAHFSPRLRLAEHQRIGRVCGYLNENFEQTISLPNLAKMIHLSESAFGRLFRRATGKTASAYLTELRVGAACKLLVENEDRVSDIAFQTGFENLSNFNRRFLAVKLMTPREYRAAFIQSGSSDS